MFAVICCTSEEDKQTMLLPQVVGAAASQAVSDTLFLSRLGPAGNQGAAVTAPSAIGVMLLLLLPLSCSCASCRAEVWHKVTQYSLWLHIAPLGIELCITLHHLAELCWGRANIILETLQRNLQNKNRNEDCVQKSVQPLAASRWHSHPQMTEFARPDVSLKT